MTLASIWHCKGICNELETRFIVIMCVICHHCCQICVVCHHCQIMCNCVSDLSLNTALQGDMQWARDKIYCYKLCYLSPLLSNYAQLCYMFFLLELWKFHTPRLSLYINYSFSFWNASKIANWTCQNVIVMKI